MKKDFISLDNIWGELKPGDIVLKQVADRDTISKPQLVIIAGIGVWDMAMAVYYTDYKTFQSFDMDNEPKIEGFGEWMQYWVVLGHWTTMPDFKTLLAAYKKMEINGK